MSYKPGDLKITAKCGHAECDDDYQCIHSGIRVWVCDSREPNYRHDDPAKPPYEKHGAYLEHSCDEWFIGGYEELLAFRDDIDKAIARLNPSTHALHRVYPAAKP